MMKKIAITGHTGEVGKFIANAYKELGYEIIGISRSTGYDISNPNHRERILSTIAQCDVFVNCAHVGYEQISLLNEMRLRWLDLSNKLIINISNLDSEYSKKNNEYLEQKKALHRAHRDLVATERGPASCLAKAGKSASEENFSDWAKELVKQLENPDYYVVEFCIWKKEV